GAQEETEEETLTNEPDARARGAFQSPSLACRACKGVTAVAVRIRMKMMGRKHRQYFRIVAIDHRQPRDGRVIEELGSYDPQVRNTDERVKLKPDRIKYWMSVGAKPSENVAIFLKKYMAKFEEQAAQAQAAQAAPATEAPAPAA